MYLHIGNNLSVPVSDIIGIFDCDFSTRSETTKKFLKESQKDGRLISEIGDIPKSFVVLKNHDVYLSTLASPILLGRLKTVAERL